MYNVSNLFVVIGAHNRDKGSIYLVDKLIAHPSYDLLAKTRDIGIVKLSRDVQYTDMVGPVCLPQKEPVVGTSCVATGWGWTTISGSIYKLSILD